MQVHVIQRPIGQVIESAPNSEVRQDTKDKLLRDRTQEMRGRQARQASADKAAKPERRRRLRRAQRKAPRPQPGPPGATWGGGRASRAVCARPVVC